MHIAIFKISNRKIYIDLDNKINKIISYQYENNQQKFLNVKEVLALVSELFDQTRMVFLKKVNDYDIYLNKDTEYFHFFKAGKEDYIKFFIENGQSAILYSSENNSHNKKHPKFFRNKTTRNTFLLTLYSIILLTPSILNTVDKIEYLINKESLIREYSNPEQFSESLTFSENLTKTEKKLFENETLFQEIATTKIDYDRVKSLEEKLDDINIKDYTKEEKKAYESGKLKAVGYYNILIPNQISVYDLNDADTKVHEFIHLLEENYEYCYIVEALTEIIKKEFYQEQISEYKSTYPDEQKRTKVLMEIIGSRILWDMIFTGDTEEFEEKISNLLSKEESEKFLSLISLKPSTLTDEEKLKNHQEIDGLLSVMYQNKYQESIKDDKLISLIYDDDESIFIQENNRRYFNDAENKENRVDFSIIEKLPLKH